MAENNNFRIAVRGYNKEDVNRFILESDRLHREAEAELQEKIQLLSEERDILREEIATVNNSLALANQNTEEKINQLVTADEKIAELETKLNVSENTLLCTKQEAQKNISELEDLVSETEKSLSNIKHELAKKQDELTSALAEIVRLKSENEVLSGKLTEQTKQNESLKEANSAQLAANSAQIDAYNALQAEYNKLSCENETLHNENHSLSNKITDLDNELTKLLNAPKAPEEPTEYGELLIELEALKSELVNTQLENESLRTRVAAIPMPGMNDDHMQTRLGEVILQANRTAEQIIKEANSTARLIKMGAVEEATVIKKNFEEKMEQRAERAGRMLSELSDKYFKLYESTKDELAKEVAALIQEKQLALKEQADAMKKETEDGLLLTDAQAAALLN
ncbi:MAG: hypothetical protein E7616_04020 [Ruminococcaceae bacterium]|nr:hypothetical protein [Oscillospiraceae bacterium]